MNTVYERAVAEAAKRAFNGETGAEGVLAALWSGYCDALVGPLQHSSQFEFHTLGSEPTMLEPKLNTLCYKGLYEVCLIQGRCGRVILVIW
jgi:hypothetical protein